MCRILCVSEAGYYKYKRNLGKPGKDETLSAAIKSIIDESEYNDNLGVPRMQLLSSAFLTTLSPDGEIIEKNTVPASMSAVVTRESPLMKKNSGFLNLKRRTVN